MRRFAFFVALLSLSFSFAAFVEQYEGSGFWKSSDGKSGRCTSISVIVDQTEDLKITDTIMFGDQTLSMTYILMDHQIDSSFFNVMNINGDVIGNGYCWAGEEPGSKMCDSSFVVDNDVKIKINTNILGKTVQRFGSKFSLNEGVIYAWNETMNIK